MHLCNKGISQRPIVAVNFESTPKPANLLLQNGFTFPEILIAATLFLLMIAAIIAVIRKGADLDTNNLHRRQARMIICGILEDPEYSSQNYSKLVFASAVQRTKNEILDGPAGGGQVSCIITITIHPPQQVSTIDAIQIDVAAAWSEATFNDAMTISKLIAQTF